MSSAFLPLVMNSIGLGLGSILVGASSDFFRASHPYHSLQIALYLLASFYALALLLFPALARALRNERRTSGEMIR
jgi:preprotein translocase subunit SecG